MPYILSTGKDLYAGRHERTGRIPRLASVVFILCISVLVPLTNRQSVQGGEVPGNPKSANTALGSRADTSNVLTALEIKTHNDKPIELAKAKLLTMDDRRAQLLSRLSDRITADEKSPGSGIAFLLTAVLIILS
jgi:hypothetical protein